MKLRFNDLTLSRSPADCIRDLIAFAPVYAAVRTRLNLDSRVYATWESATGCTLGDVFRYVARNRAALEKILSQKEAFVLTNIVSIVLIEKDSCASSFATDELGREVEAAEEALASGEGMLSIGLDYPQGREPVQTLRDKNGVLSERQAVCVTRRGHLAEDVFKRIAFCHAAKFRPGVMFGNPRCQEYERLALLDAMKAGKYTEDKIDDHEATLDEVVGVSLACPTKRIHICLLSRFLHLYPCP